MSKEQSSGKYMIIHNSSITCVCKRKRLKVIERTIVGVNELLRWRVQHREPLNLPDTTRSIDPGHCAMYHISRDFLRCIAAEA